MPNRSSSPKRSSDINQLAADIFGATATDASTPATSKSVEKAPADAVKNIHAAELGRLGGLKGGRARAMKLSAARRSEIARKAAEARWHTGQGTGDSG